MPVLSTSQMPALQVQTPDLRIAENYEAGVNARINQTTAQMQQQAQQIEMLASGAAYAMPNGPNGDVDPVKWNEVLDSYEESGMPPDKVAAFRDRPELAKVLLHSSASALAAARDEQLFPLKLAELEANIAKAMAGGEQFRTLSADEVKQMGLPPGSYQVGGDGKISQIGGGGVNVTNNMGENGVDYGSPGAGLVWQRAPDGKVFLDERGAPVAIPFKGGKAYADAEAAAAAGEVRDERENLKADVVVQDADRALQQIAEDPFWTTGLGAQMSGWAGGSPAKNVEKLISTVKANAGFQELQAMRESSPTGGALGNVTEKEIAYLQATIGNLEQDQSADQLIDNLKRVKNAYLDIIHGPGNGPPRDKLSFESEDGAGEDLSTMSDEDLLKQLGM